MKRFIVVVGAMLMLAPMWQQLNAAATPVRWKDEQRSVQFTYNPSQGYPVTFYYGYSTHIILSKDEVVLSSLPGLVKDAWDITNPAPHIIGLRPLVKEGGTSNILITTLVRTTGEYRTYNIESNVFPPQSIDESPTDLMWRVSFYYVKPKPKTTSTSGEIESATPPLRPPLSPVPEELWSDNYSFQEDGDLVLKPIKIRDDGFNTFFRFPKDRKWPLIYAVEANGKSKVVNPRRIGDYIRIDGVHYAFELLQSNLRLCILNLDRAEPKKTKFVRSTYAAKGKVKRQATSEPSTVPEEQLVTVEVPKTEGGITE